MAVRQARDEPQKVVPIARELETQEAPNEETDSARMERAGTILRQGVPTVATALLTGAARGGITHIKLALDLVGIDKGAFAAKDLRPKEKTLHEKLWEQWEREP